MTTPNEPLPGTRWTVGFRWTGVDGKQHTTTMSDDYWTAGGAEHAWEITKQARDQADAENVDGPPMEWTLIRQEMFDDGQEGRYPRSGDADG